MIIIATCQSMDNIDGMYFSLIENSIYTLKSITTLNCQIKAAKSTCPARQF